GQTLFSGRLPGPGEFARPGCGSKRHIPCPRMIPVPGTARQEPNRPPCEIVTLTRLPSASAAATCVVPWGLAPDGGEPASRVVHILCSVFAILFQYSGSVSGRTGTRSRSLSAARTLKPPLGGRAVLTAAPRYWLDSGSVIRGAKAAISARVRMPP